MDVILMKSTQDNIRAHLLKLQDSKMSARITGQLYTGNKSCVLESNDLPMVFKYISKTTLDQLITCSRFYLI